MDCFQQAAKLEPGRRIGICLPVQVDPIALANRVAVENRVHHALVRQTYVLCYPFS